MPRMWDADHRVRDRASKQLSDAGPSLDGLRLLIVDDNEDTRVIFETIFTHLGAVVFTAKGGAEALAIAATNRPHVIVSDLSMPQMDGLEFMRRMRALPGEADQPTPAIAISGFVRDEDRERARLAGYQAFLPKPAEPILVAREIARLAQTTPTRGRRR